MTRVRVGIVSWNTAALLERCLTALPAATEGLEVDVTVVDNHSDDGSAEVAARFTGVTVIRNDANLGYGKAINQALAHQGDAYDVLIALNPDTVAPPRSLTELTEHLMADPEVALVAPRLVNEDGSLQHTVYRFPSPLITAIICAIPFRLQRGRLAEQFWLEGRVPHNQPCDVDWAIGAVHAVRAEALDALAPYDERWFMYVEDMDLCWRLRAAGRRVRFEPGIEVLHTGNAAGAQAWGDTRTERWWAATYDWYRQSHGVAAVRRYARINVLGVRLLMVRARLRRRLATDVEKKGLFSTRLHDLERILPTHRTMARDPDAAFPRGVLRAPGSAT